MQEANQDKEAVAALIEELDGIADRLDNAIDLQVPDDKTLKLALAAALCRLSSSASIAAGNIVVGIDE